ncbi:hypothetical protein COW80_03365 [Candidatus Beckwithbacteria bacterium CG22_combo_CG10-13_8_21_14_all_01_47_9]|uniref:PIN domain-containing protein n=5 Tax=Candidatus Beckwithiibacteriota TaxID=1752726 RepID=A0A2H0E176_9BACT|nr:MAG: hypothetical protein AUJ59_01730 [Candidatus Beckwithbacteria bacterium CG1_02_47_37]PIP51871.1 MAG: hypothetical protein COX09_04695 [Candidatus Beckwithbacteria bacterium CG23_combo_of_CG06-09_8_20_14_all_47_9]PIP87888.1 MAG: hypothetical protein COW80_03365 [Candidatus Beckwithbacteria bacterium CG22_combo_CG10-13_8_21_14_all_01_47_9]PJA21339.1 MAG: hypothetical protein COX59_04475 [Candidatus Beckwithbacteria bacterium CG_4_10_14_0_2_um_filter_47_25]PJC66089.1 MAG: hypothetical prot
MAENTNAVIDASLVLAWLMPDERGEAVNRIFEAKKQFYSPKLLLYELINGLKMAVIRNRISWQEAGQAIVLFRRLGLRLVDQESQEEKILNLAKKLNLTVYDAAYAALAKKLKLKLLSLDKKLAKL